MIDQNIKINWRNIMSNWQSILVNEIYFQGLSFYARNEQNNSVPIVEWYAKVQVTVRKMYSMSFITRIEAKQRHFNGFWKVEITRIYVLCSITRNDRILFQMLFFLYGRSQHFPSFFLFNFLSVIFSVHGAALLSHANRGNVYFSSMRTKSIGHSIYQFDGAK